jgi:hypothetical protein
MAPNATAKTSAIVAAAAIHRCCFGSDPSVKRRESKENSPTTAPERELIRFRAVRSESIAPGLQNAPDNPISPMHGAGQLADKALKR